MRVRQNRDHQIVFQRGYATAVPRLPARPRSRSRTRRPPYPNSPQAFLRFSHSDGTTGDSGFSTRAHPTLQRPTPQLTLRKRTRGPPSGSGR